MAALHSTHTHTTVLWPFFWDPPGELVPEENFWTLLCNVHIADADIIFCSCGFFFFFPRLFSAVADWMSIILPHMMWPYCEFRVQVWNVLNAGSQKIQDTKNRHLHTFAQLCWAVSSQLRHVSTIGKNLLNSNISCTFSQYAELRLIRGWDRFTSLGHPSKFQLVSCVGFVTSTKLCTMFGWVGTLYIHLEGGSCTLTEFGQVQNSLCVQVLCYPILAALLHGTRAVGVSETLRHGIFTL